MAFHFDYSADPEDLAEAEDSEDPVDFFIHQPFFLASITANLLFRGDFKIFNLTHNNIKIQKIIDPM